MKNVVFGICATLLVSFTVIGLLALEGRTGREKELSDALRLSARQAMSDLYENENFCIDDDEELAADFNELMLEKLKSGEDPNFRIHIEIMEADAQKGILVVKAVEQFTHPNGKIGEAKADVAVILEQEQEKKTFQVRYLVPWKDAKRAGLPYVKGQPTVCASFEIEEGRKLKIPGISFQEEASWVVVSGAHHGEKFSREQLLKIKVQGDMELSAAFQAADRG